MRWIVKSVPFLVTVALVGCVCIQVPTLTTPTATPTAVSPSPMTPAPGSTPSPIPPTPPPTATSIPTPKPSARPFGQVTPSFQVKAEPLDTGIKLQWPPVSGASGYLIYRGSYAEPLNIAPIQDTLYEDIGLTTGRTYSYTVAAVDPAGQVISLSVEVAAAAGGK